MRAISLLVICAWLVASNHCALGLMLPEKNADVSSSCNHCQNGQSGQSSKSKNNGDASPCCRSLQGTMAVSAKNFVHYDAGQLALPPPFALFLQDERLDFLLFRIPCETDTGPPGVVSFAESILQRSILAHAPPASA